MKHILSLVAGLLAVSTPASASVVYHLTDTNGTDVEYRSAGFITADVTLPASALKRCVLLAYTCIDVSYLTSIDDLQILVSTGAGLGSVNFFTPPGAFGAFGSYVTTGNDGVLTVSAGVPEPGTWTMMVGGLALAGAATRRRSGKKQRANEIMEHPRLAADQSLVVEHA